MSKPLYIWFTDDGAMLHDAGRYEDMMASNANIARPYKCEVAQDFEDQLVFVKISDYYRGLARVKFISAITGRTYVMYANDFNKVVEANRFINNQVKGTFRFMKKGMAQTIQLVLPVKP